MAAVRRPCGGGSGADVPAAAGDGMHRHISHAKATAEPGYEPRPLRDTVRDTLEWFRGEGMLDEA